MTNPLRLFLVACLYPGGLLERSRRPVPRGNLLDPFNLPGPSDDAFERLILRKVDLGIGNAAPADVVMTGDQVYVDATAGLFDPSQRDEPLERTYAMLKAQPWRAMALEHLEQFTLMDDHEVGDNWEPSAHVGRDNQLKRDMAAALPKFLQEQRNPARRSSLFYADTLRSGHALFVGDSRTERSVRNAKNLQAARIMSNVQMNALVTTLAASPQQRWKFAATSSVLLPRRLSTAESKESAGIRSDAWDGYPTSLHKLLGEIADQGLQNCVFLSGDEHIPCVAEIELTPKSAPKPTLKLWSVHAGALYAPYPFANARTEDFAEDDTFDFVSPAGTAWVCKVTARFPQHLEDGFVEISGSDGTPLDVVFRSAHGPGRDHAFPRLV